MEQIKNRLKELNESVIVKTTKGEIEEKGASWLKEEIEKGNKELNKAGLYGLVRIDEGGINRLLSHGKDGFVIVSANRGEIYSENPNNDLTNEYYKWLKDNNQQDNPNAQNIFLKQRNNKADKQLMADIVVAGYSYSPVYGGYKGTDGVVDNFEPSFVVYNNQSKQQTQGNTMVFNRLYKFAIDICKKYKQDSVYIKAPNQAPIYVDCNGNKVNSRESNNTKINRETEPYFTTAKRDKNGQQRFTSDIEFEESIKRELNENYPYIKRGFEYTDRMRRTQRGEMFL